MRRRVDGREVLGAAFFATGLFALIHLTPPTLFRGVDWLQLHLPAREYMAAALLSGRLPLWNPHVALGRPFLADIETAVFYPPNLVHLVLTPRAAYALIAAAHAILGFWGMLWLGRHLRLDPWVRWLCAALFLSSQALVARLQGGQTHYVQAITYVPLLLFLAARLGDRPSGARALGLAALLGLQLLCGHPQIAWLTWVGLGAFVLGRMEWGGEDGDHSSTPHPIPPHGGGGEGGSRIAVPAGVGRAGHPRPAARPALLRAARGLGALGAAILGGLALAAPTLLPFLEMIGQGNRAPNTLEASGRDGMAAFHWSSLAVPDGGLAAFYWEFNVYTGLAVLVGGVAGLLATARERDSRGLWLMGVVGVLLGGGSRTPAFGLFYFLVPGTSVFRLHARAALLVVLVLILGLGLFLSRRPRPRVVVVGLGLGSVVAGLLVAVYQWEAPPGLVPLPPLGRLAWLAAVLAPLAAVGLATDPRRRAWASAALVAVVVADVGLAIPPAKRAWDERVEAGNREVREQGERLIHEGLRSRGLYGARGIPPRIAIPPGLARENAGAVYGWSSIAGYQAVSLARVWVYLHDALGLSPPRESTFPSPLIYERGPFPYDSMNLVAGVDPQRGLVERGTPDPRAYVASAARVLGTWREAPSLMREGHDFHRVALLEAPLEPPLPLEPVDERSPHARIETFEAERVTVRTDSTRPGVLVLAEPWYPGWEAQVDGQPAPCVPANAWMRAVPLPAGRHRVVLRFRSRWLGPGVAVAFGALLVLGAWAWRDRRRSEPGEP